MLGTAIKDIEGMQDEDFQRPVYYAQHGQHHFTEKRESKENESKKASKDLVDEILEQSEEDTKGSEESNLMSEIPDVIKEALIILVLFIILSQPIIKINIGKVIKQIVPDEEGKVGMPGVIIYGMLLSLLYIFFKKYFL